MDSLLLSIKPTTKIQLRRGGQVVARDGWRGAYQCELNSISRAHHHHPMTVYCPFTYQSSHLCVRFCSHLQFRSLSPSLISGPQVE